MDFQSYQSLIKEVGIGKHLPDAIYVHQQAFELLPDQLTALIPRIAKAVKIRSGQWHIIKLFKRDFRITFLSYPSFFEEPYPPLAKSWTVDLSKLSVREANYSKSENPPILHRRETFVTPSHPQIDFFKSFTKEGEAIGLYDNTRLIGFRNSWQRLIKAKGYYLDDTQHLQPLMNKPLQSPSNPFSGDVERHKTALSRDKLSLPMFLLGQRNYLNGDYSVLDYGCGKGDDLRELEEHGISCAGWDPAHRPDADLLPSDIVNLGYVINVIEDKNERIETLQRAYGYAEKILIVSAMLGNEQVYERFTPYKDGVITKRNTFQKYFFQGELQHFIEETLNTNAMPLGPGIFMVFKDKVEEQNYLLEKQKRRHQWRQLTTRPPKPIKEKRLKNLFADNLSLFEDFWYTSLDLARVPANDEFELSAQIRHLTGSHIKAFKLCSSYFDSTQFEKAQAERKDDLLVYFALSFFNKRAAYQRMPISLQRDIKTFFNKYSIARDQGKKLLYSLSDSGVIYETCVTAHQILPASQLNEQHDLIFHKQYLDQCPKELRVYVGCALQMYGELDEIQLIKAHITSGKVSLMGYKNWESEVPMLVERIKIKLRDQEIDFFDYVGDFEPQPLEHKRQFLAE